MTEVKHERSFDGRQQETFPTRDGAKAAPARKRAERLASEIEREIMRAGWPIGQVIGTERDLLDRYGVSRAVFREAVRLLEHHRVATMRAGSSGGLIVTAPDVTALTRAATLYLDFQGVSLGDLYEARLSLELQSVERTVQNLNEAGIRRLRETLEREESNDRPGHHTHELHGVLAELSGNPALKLFVDVLVSLTEWHISAATVPADVLFPKDRIAESQRAHRAIVEAIIAGDLALAVHRTRAHVNAIHDALPLRPEPRSGGAKVELETPDQVPEKLEG
ncbi:FadR/GntR family transcriptional regulator [Aeromicrobium panaciterrae]|uniref:FadR/GntR family transcriptional regulator n=1 Tax=Aeromicrobium panaciterrae TaxID=363861 RepID=UPI0031DC3311